MGVPAVDFLGPGAKGRTLRCQLLLQCALLGGLLAGEEELFLLAIGAPILRGVGRARNHTLLLRATLAHLIVVNLRIVPI